MTMIKELGPTQSMKCKKQYMTYYNSEGKMRKMHIQIMNVQCMVWRWVSNILVCNSIPKKSQSDY